MKQDEKLFEIAMEKDIQMMTYCPETLYESSDGLKQLLWNKITDDQNRVYICSSEMAILILKLFPELRATENVDKLRLAVRAVPILRDQLTTEEQNAISKPGLFHSLLVFAGLK
jgi:hypothetical protein